MVHTLMLTNKEADRLIAGGDVEIDGKRIHDNCLLADGVEIRVKGETIQAKKKLVYLKFNKPAGYQSTLNAGTENSLADFFKAHDELFIAGRLDKASEGLLILSNDGKWVENICNPKFEKEKEYEVTLDKMPGELFYDAFQKGVDIGGYFTQPCQCALVYETTVRVILTEGKNRQIRRMCGALGYKVVQLKRTRIGKIVLSDLKPGECENIEVAII